MPKLLVLAEHEAGQLKLATLSAVAFARSVVSQAGGGFEILVIGEQVTNLAEALRSYGASAVLTADHPKLKNPVSDKYAEILAQVIRARDHTMIAAAASTFSKDVLPRASALLDAGMLSDVTEA